MQRRDSPSSDASRKTLRSLLVWVERRPAREPGGFRARLRSQGVGPALESRQSALGQRLGRILPSLVDLCRSCNASNCSNGCSAARGRDVDRALSLVLSREILLDLENANGADWSLLLRECLDGDRMGTIFGSSECISSGFTPVAHPLLGPQPLLETEQEFLDRAKMAWTEAMTDLRREGLTISSPRKLQLHCE
jgi:hypothetical protein